MGVCEDTADLLAGLIPGGRPFLPPTIPLAPDECQWFLAGVRARVFRFPPPGRSW